MFNLDVEIKMVKKMVMVMVKRKIIKIDEELGTGCGECIPNCPEGAIQLIDDKARIISDIFCDGLGACIGHCPVDAITIEEREAEEYDERKVMANVVKQGQNVIKAHLEHLRDHDQHEYLQQAIDYLEENNFDVPIEKPKQQQTTSHRQRIASIVLENFLSRPHLSMSLIILLVISHRNRIEIVLWNW